MSGELIGGWLFFIAVIEWIIAIPVIIIYLMIQAIKEHKRNRRKNDEIR